MTDLSSGLVYLYTVDALLDVGSDLEDKDIWKVYLEMEDYNNALQACQTSAEKDLVLTRHAEDAISKGDNIMAAKIFAKVLGRRSAPNFTKLCTLRKMVGD